MQCHRIKIATKFHLIMSLQSQAKQILDNFDSATSLEIIEVLEQIKSNLCHDLTRQYLGKKINAIKEISAEAQKKKSCLALKPYLDWVL